MTHPAPIPVPSLAPPAPVLAPAPGSAAASKADMTAPALIPAPPVSAPLSYRICLQTAYKHLCPAGSMFFT